MAKRSKKAKPTPPEAMESAMGAGDATSGGGAGAGIPEPETVERAGEGVTRGNVKEDRGKIFPERPQRKSPPGARQNEST